MTIVPSRASRLPSTLPRRVVSVEVSVTKFLVGAAVAAAGVPGVAAAAAACCEAGSWCCGWCPFC